MKQTTYCFIIATHTNKALKWFFIFFLFLLILGTLYGGIKKDNIWVISVALLSSILLCVSFYNKTIMGYSIMMLLVACLLATWYIMMIVCVMVFIIYIKMNKPYRVCFGNSVTYYIPFRKHVAWDTIEHVVWKDYILTIKDKKNRWIQWDTMNALSAEETIEFKNFCLLHIHGEV